MYIIKTGIENVNLQEFDFWSVEYSSIMNYLEMNF